MTAKDAVAVNLLSHQLGYPLSLQQTAENIKKVTKSKDHIAYVAVISGRIVGWIGASHVIMIEVLPHCEINGLVIDKDFHGKGIGKLLIEKAKEWTREKGNSRLSLHCNIKRREAHEFYQHIGFTAAKQQTNFVLDM